MAEKIDKELLKEAKDHARHTEACKMWAPNGYCNCGLKEFKEKLDRLMELAEQRRRHVIE